MKKTPENRKKLLRLAALSGAVLAILCHLVPHEYQAACQAVAKVIALPTTCGG